MRLKPAGRRGSQCGLDALLTAFFALACLLPAAAQTAALPSPATSPAVLEPPVASPFDAWVGRTVREIRFEGVNPERLSPLKDHLPQEVGKPLDRLAVAASLRELYATGLFETIEVAVEAQGDGAALIFKGTARRFIGRISVDGAKGATLNTQLDRASRLNAGTRFTQARLDRAIELMKQTMGDNGFHEPVITPELSERADEQLVDIDFHVTPGPQARVGEVAVSGDAGMSAAEFRRRGHLKTGAKVTHDTTNRALEGVLKHYQKQERLEADVKLESQQYVPQTQHSNFGFSSNRGPVVRVRVEGVKIGADRIKRLIPVYEEGTVDEDLLNEGNRRLRDYYQRLGYFDVKVDHRREAPATGEVLIVFTVDLGTRRRVGKVSVDGNHYFTADTLEQLLSVHSADAIDRHGAYSQGLISADVNALKGVYQNNGFSSAKITPEVTTDAPAPGQSPKKPNPLNVVYHIDEGPQQRVGQLTIVGNEHTAAESLQALMNTAPGQLFSPQSLAGDRDALLTDYMSRGFDQVQIDVEQQAEAQDPAKVDVTIHVNEGTQIFVRKVLLTGLHYTRPDTVAKAVTLHPGDPLSQTALQEMQRNLYDFSLFNEVDTAVVNPNGGETYKTILVHAAEARRWTVTYGFGFEAQTGQPVNHCRNTTANPNCNPQGKTGISPRLLVDVTRNNLFGREQSISARGTYGLLEQRVNLIFQNPHFHGNRDFGLTVSGGYASSLDVTTYVSSKLEGGLRMTEHFSTPGTWLSKANTFVYELNFRRVKVSEDSLQVGQIEIAPLATATRVAGPAFTWIRDTRDSPLDAHRGTYSSFQEFLSVGQMGAEAHFNRLDVSNSSFFSFDKNRFVLARNTRYGQMRSFGGADNLLIPLPERLYAGGGTSLRSFPINAAGPRDAYTGYPLGGAGALVNNLELRLPPPMLPFFGNSVSFVLFHDMGNIFANAGSIWKSALRVEQPHRETCKDLTPPDQNGDWNSIGQKSACSFDYFSHAVGLGVRYHTPVGPIRLDFSYTLNPPIYPITDDYSHPEAAAHVGEAQHFNFFFSLGQTF